MGPGLAVPLGNKVCTWEAVAFEKKQRRAEVVAGIGYIVLRSSLGDRYRRFVNPHCEPYTLLRCAPIQLLTVPLAEHGFEGGLVARRGCGAPRHRAALSCQPSFEEGPRAALSKLVDG